MTDQPHHPHSLILEKGHCPGHLKYSPTPVNGLATIYALPQRKKQKCSSQNSAYYGIHGLSKHLIRSTTAGRTDGSCASDVPADGYGMVAVGAAPCHCEPPSSTSVPVPEHMQPIIAIIRKEPFENSTE